MDLLKFLKGRQVWSIKTFGPSNRNVGVIDHMRKELIEVEEAPGDMGEWIDLILLAFEGACRTSGIPEDVVTCLRSKQAINEAREWPDWRTAEPGKAIEHVRETKEFKPACFGSHYAELGPCCINCKLSYKCRTNRGPIA